MDRLTREQRSKNMKAVKSKDSQLEVTLRKALWAKGFRYRKNVSSIIGKPDIAIKKYKIAVFCDSEFWHGFDWDNRKVEIKSNREFWLNKIESNIKRDKVVNEQLNKDGWIVLRFWGKEIQKNLDNCVLKIEEAINSRKQMSYKFD